jgi:ribosomal protein S18 acetylase RimI-like enzyme
MVRAVTSPGSNAAYRDTNVNSADGQTQFEAVLASNNSGGTQFGFGNNPALRAGAQGLVAYYGTLIAEGRIRDAPALATVLASIEDKIVNSPSQLIVAYEGSPSAPRVIGVLSYDTTNFGQRAIEVDGMLVDPSSQGRSVGTQMLQAAWDRVWPGSNDKVIRLVSIPSAVGFYRSIGGEVRERPNAWPVVEFHQRPGSSR